MKNITSINFKTLRNDEFRSIMNDGVQFAKAITNDDAKDIIASFEVSVNAFGDFLETNVEDSLERVASGLDSERNAIYASCKKVAKALLNYPDESIAEVGTQIWRVFNKAPDPRGLNQSQSTGVILGVIESLANIDAAKLKTCGFKVWMEKLVIANDKYMDADRARNSERGKRELEQGKKLRESCTEAYRIVSAYATAKAALGDTTCANFIDCINGVISSKKVQLKSRKRKNESENKEQTNSPASVVPSTVAGVRNVA